MDISDAITVVGIAIAAILGIVAIFAARRWGTRPGRLLFTTEMTPLVPIAPEFVPHLMISYRDIPIPDPHLLFVSLTNVGSRDISTGHYDAGRPIEIHLGAALFGVLSNTHPQRTLIHGIGSTDPIAITPGLIRRREIIELQLIVSGQPGVAIESPLIDVALVDGSKFDWRRDLAPTLAEELILTLPGGRLATKILKAMRP